MGFFGVMELPVLLGVLSSCLLSASAQEGLGFHFTKQPTSVVAPPGDEVLFTCDINLHPDHLTWLHDWKVVEPGSDPSVTVQPGRLLVRVGLEPEVYRRQTGEYRCMAWIAPIALTSLPAKLSIARLGAFPARGNVTIIAAPGGTVSIRCPPPASDPPATVQFYRDGQLVTNRGDTVTVLPGGRLHVSDVSPALAGTYTCTASNHLTGELETAPFVTRLQVQRPQGPAPPRLVVPPEPMYRAEPDSTVRIECVADGWPLPVVAWKRLDGHWSARYVQHAASLEIRQLRASDQGDYVCEVASSRGSLTAATVVRLIEPPSVETTPSDLTVPEGSPAALACSGRGQPPPRLQWVVHGHPVLGGSRPEVRGDTLQFSAVRREDAGLYQCFGHSESGHAKAAVLLKVIPRQMDEMSASTATSTPAPTVRQPGTGGRRRGNGRRNREGAQANTGRNRDGELMVAPSAPRVYPISESSVMLQWDVPPNDGLTITFFKIQYRRAPRRRHDWQTHDSDIPGSARSFEVDGLEVGAKYKFRVLAVYENQDNKHGPNSRKVKMTRMRKKAKPPGAPVVTSQAPQSPNAIRFSWRYRNLQAAPIEGYFIFYRDTTMAGDYSKVTVLGETTKAHILTSLLPSTAYDIKLQAFNLEGGVSDFSPIVTERTLDSPDAPSTVSPVNEHVPIVTTRGVDQSRVRLYAIVGGVLGLLLLLALLFSLVYYCRSRAPAKHNQAKFADTSQQMHLQQQQQQPFTIGDSELHQLHQPGDSPEPELPLRHQLQPPGTPPPPLPFKQRASALSESAPVSIPVAIPTAPCCGDSPSPEHAAEHAAAAAVLNNNKYGDDAVERRRRIRRKDSIETQRHRLSGR